MTRALLALAGHDLRLALRQRWVLAYGLSFAVLTAGISYFGLAVVELTGWQELDRTAAGLLNLVLYLVPLATMLMAVQSLRSEGGATDQLFAEPISRTSVLLGKAAGLSVAHLASVLFGFGFTGVLIGMRVGSMGLLSYLVLVGFTVLLGVIFIGIASLLTILAQRTLRAYALVLAAWFVLTLLFDLLLIGMSFVLPEEWATRLAIAGLFLDPIDGTRVGTLLAIGGKEMFGAAGAQLARALGGVPQAIAALVGSLLLWAVAPLALGAAILRRQDL